MEITTPTLIMHGTDDRMVPSSHGEWIAAHCPTAELRLEPGAGHISVFTLLRKHSAGCEGHNRLGPRALRSEAPATTVDVTRLGGTRQRVFVASGGFG
jgi:alpha/beta hydrolase fold